MLIGILQTGQAPPELQPRTGDYPQMFERLLAGHGFSFRTYLVEQMQFPASVEECDGWLITGSRHGVYEPHEFIPLLENFIQNAILEEAAVVGVCFGHQIIAKAMGGTVEQYAEGWAVGLQEYRFDDKTVKMNAWHRDQVIKAPGSATVVASSDFCQIAALSYGDSAFSVQAHPEFDDVYIKGLMETRGRGVVPPHLMSAAFNRLGQRSDSSLVGLCISKFFLRTRTNKA